MAGRQDPAGLLSRRAHALSRRGRWYLAPLSPALGSGNCRDGRVGPRHDANAGGGWEALKRDSQRGLKAGARGKQQLLNKLGGHLRHHQHAPGGRVASNLKGLVRPDAKPFVLKALKDGLVGAHAGYPILIAAAAGSFGTGRDQNDGAIRARDPGGVPERLLRLVEVNVLGMPAGRGNQQIEGSRDVDLVELEHQRNAFPHDRLRFAGEDPDDLFALIDDRVEGEVDSHHPPDFFHVLTGGIVLVAGPGQKAGRASTRGCG